MRPTVEILETDARFTITARSTLSTVYTATLPVCWCERTPCVAAYDHGKTLKSAAPGCDGGESKFCHGMRAYHRAHVERMAAEVAKTFKPWKPRPATIPGLPAWQRRTGHTYADCPAWPVLEDKRLPAAYQPLLTGCDCESCRATIAQFGRAA